VIAELVATMESECLLEALMITCRISIGAPVTIDHEAVKDSGPILTDNPVAFSEDVFVSGAVGTTGDKAPDIGLESGVVLPEFGGDTSDTSLERAEVAAGLHPGKAVLGIAVASCTEEHSSDKQSQSHV
jgi:hypothetical protein